MKPTMLTVRRRFHPEEFRFLDLDRSQVLEAVEYDMHCWCLVIGNGSIASYEWVLLGADYVDHSDWGYGSPAFALRNGLNMAMGYD